MGRLEAIEAELERARLAAQIPAATAWVRAAEVDPAVSVSVVLATRDRAGWLPRAIRSVLAQSHPCWELVVVDDASTDETPAVLAGFDDPRIRTVTLTEPGGAAAARNRGLAQAGGDVVAYLDDDNLMGADWVKALAWLFSTRADVDVAYGARVVEDPRGFVAAPAASLPAVHFAPYDRGRLEQGNFVDSGVLGHRRGLCEARFDETLRACIDWDLVLRLTESEPPVALPVIAGLYSMGAPGRISREDFAAEECERVRQRWTRPAVL